LKSYTLESFDVKMAGWKPAIDKKVAQFPTMLGATDPGGGGKFVRWLRHQRAPIF